MNFEDPTDSDGNNVYNIQVFADDGFQLCSTAYGVLIETETGDSPRLPLTVDLGGIYVVTVMVAAGVLNFVIA